MLLMDVGIVGTSGTDWCELLAAARKASPVTKLVGMSVAENPTYLARAHTAGTSDFVWEGATGSDFVRAIEQAATGKGPAHSRLFAAVIASLHGNTPSGKQRELPGAKPLTPREQQVLRHIGYGLSNDEIARSLGIGPETVEEHVQNLLRKLKASDRTAAAVMAVRAGLV